MKRNTRKQILITTSALLLSFLVLKGAKKTEEVPQPPNIGNKTWKVLPNPEKNLLAASYAMKNAIGIIPTVVKETLPEIDKLMKDNRKTEKEIRVKIQVVPSQLIKIAEDAKKRNNQIFQAYLKEYQETVDFTVSKYTTAEKKLNNNNMAGINDLLNATKDMALKLTKNFETTSNIYLKNKSKLAKDLAEKTNWKELLRLLMKMTSNITQVVGKAEVILATMNEKVITPLAGNTIIGIPPETPRELKKTIDTIKAISPMVETVLKTINTVLNQSETE